jgi:hypothetical protein
MSALPCLAAKADAWTMSVKSHKQTRQPNFGLLVAKAKDHETGSRIENQAVCRFRS